MIPFPGKKYQIIVVDPPWPVKKLARRTRPKQMSMDYPIMPLDEIEALPVGDLAAKPCFCFLWTTQKFLRMAFDILEGWGFSHLLTMVWQKTYGRSTGMPLYGFRWNAEFALVGYNRKPPLWPKQNLIPCCFSAPNIRHSQKPQLFYDMISRLGSPRIDLFARQRQVGWDVWGNEVQE